MDLSKERPLKCDPYLVVQNPNHASILDSLWDVQGVHKLYSNGGDMSYTRITDCWSVRYRWHTCTACESHWYFIDFHRFSSIFIDFH